MKKVNVLGTEYTIEEKTEEQDCLLKDCDGYCDKTTKAIVLLKVTNDNCDLHDVEWYRRKVLRHEIIHAFLFESGLHENTNPKDKAHDEQMVDWIATQFAKLWKAFKEADCL